MSPNASLNASPNAPNASPNALPNPSLKTSLNILWLRRDLRLHDNAALYHALRGDRPVLPVFIFDRDILDELEDTDDQRVVFIYEALSLMNDQLQQLGSVMDARYGVPSEVFAQLIRDYDIGAVYTNHDYEPYARKRDPEVAELLKKSGIGFKSYKDQVILEKSEVVKDDGKPYTVFTPYSRRWKAVLNDFYLKPYPVEKYFSNLLRTGPIALPTLKSMGFSAGNYQFPDKRVSLEIVQDYHQTRDIPSIAGTTRMSVHLRFGTVSIRELANESRGRNETYLNELIWREFYQQILWHFPEVQTHAFRREYDRIKWRNDEKEFDAWCNGMTGYPIVDAGMRELNATGFMHNRVRMVVASFLVKHLLIDWRWGEAYFARKLLDFDLASNNGGWQWAAGSGVDAAPYFRIFNPYLQTKRFDPQFNYIRKWVPDFEEFIYPKPIVDHVFARERCLKVYKAALAK